MIYEEDGDQIIQVGDICPSCGSEHTEYDRYYKYWKCEICSTVWGDAIEESEDQEVEPNCVLGDDDPDSDYVRFISGLKMD